MMADMTLSDLRGRSKGADVYATLADAVAGIRAAGRLPSSVSSTTVLGYGVLITGSDPDSMAAWENRDRDPKGRSTEMNRLGYELATMVQTIKGRGNGGGRPSEAALTAATGSDRAWRNYTDTVIGKKRPPPAKAPKDYAGVDDIADGLGALGRIPDYVPRPLVLGYTYGLLNSAPDFHKAWVGYNEDSKPFEDLMPVAARALAAEISRIQAGPSQASPPRPFTPAQESRMSDGEYRAYQQDLNGVTG
jgi:hypothetical protein